MSSPPSTEELPKQYDHRAAQTRWYRFWEDRGYFHSEPEPGRKRFSIVIPPPNVTGALHLGHALNNSLQDIIVRYKRMQGFNALWMPGTDHAGIATQAVVERRLLSEEKKSRHDLGREELVRRIWQWKAEYETRILGQLKQMGCSCDWQRTRFTLDEQCARAVRHTFFDFFRKRLIYRGKRLVNWDTFLQTAVSDDEVFHETVKGHFWHLKYPVIDPQPGEPEFVTIATTRPETMLGDTAVAVHPDPAAALDAAEKSLREKLAAASAKELPEIEAELEKLAERRRTHLPELLKLRDMARAGRQLELPLLKRPIPLVADEWAKPEMGSGAVKITPGHDPNDYEVGQRQKLPMINILNADGTLNENAGPYQGLSMSEARRRVVADLETAELMGDIEDREIELAHSDRSKTPIEPRLADQWFVRMQQLAQTAMDAVTDERVQIFPARYAKSYLDWLGEKRDWPVSRQLWWGHQIPVWYAPAEASDAELKRAFEGRDDISWERDAETNRWLICARDADLSADALAPHKLVREEDVLDTWFSSALWPHSTLGWPDATPELQYYYPTDLLITSRDIITLWVARMVLTGLSNVGDVPFRHVYIHPKILDRYGDTMSKSKGNGVDPLDVIDKFGADALRFGIAYLATETQDIRMPVEFECPHCHKLVEQTRENRLHARIKCPSCGEAFGTQWAEKDADRQLPRGAVVSERFEFGRNFSNKLWNASRFAIINLAGYEPGTVTDDELALEDRWVLSRLATVTGGVTKALEEYKFAEAAGQLYSFAWDEFCSFYLEMSKGRLQDESQRPAAQRVLAHVLDSLLRLLHPFIPFLTEEVWQRLATAAPVRGLTTAEEPAESIMIAAWPAADTARRDAAVESRFARFQELLTGLRDVRARQTVPSKTTLKFAVRCDAETARELSSLAPYFASQAGAEATAWGPSAIVPDTHAKFLAAGCEVFVDLAGLIDVPAEIAKTEREREKTAGFVAAKVKKLSNATFVERAPAEVVAAERASLAELEARLASLDESLARLRAQK
jgi:valyl-tRNA synthetase